MNKSFVTLTLCVCLTIASPSGLARQPATGSDATAATYGQTARSRDGIGKTYLGREISEVMGWQGADWLDRTDRVKEERPDLLLEGLALKPGMTVADVGAGTGYYTWLISPRVGDAGKVYAVDVQPEMVRMIKERMQKRGAGNVLPVLASATDTRLPAATVDLALMVDVYHELEYPAEVLDSIVRSLKPGGRVVFVEYRAEDPAVPIKPLHKMSEAQIRREATRHGLSWEKTINNLPWQHMVIFRRN
jgi:ubiquinone/menaquinone biosynthesis C-methylase UbiE